MEKPSTGEYRGYPLLCAEHGLTIMLYVLVTLSSRPVLRISDLLAAFNPLLSVYELTGWTCSDHLQLKLLYAHSIALFL